MTQRQPTAAQITAATRILGHDHKRTYAVGTQGATVRALQIFLAAKGYAPGKFDGIWGKNTQKALEQYAQSTGQKFGRHVTPQALRTIAADLRGDADVPMPRLRPTPPPLEPVPLEGSATINGGTGMAVQSPPIRMVPPPALDGAVSINGGEGAAFTPGQPLQMVQPSVQAPPPVAAASPSSQSIGFPGGKEYPDVMSMAGDYANAAAAPFRGASNALGDALSGLNRTANMRAQDIPVQNISLGPSGAGADASGQNFPAPGPDPSTLANMPDWLQAQYQRQGIDPATIGQGPPANEALGSLYNFITTGQAGPPAPSPPQGGDVLARALQSSGGVQPQSQVQPTQEQKDAAIQALTRALTNSRPFSGAGY